MKQRYLVYGSYTDERQVVEDVVDAESDEEAMRLVSEARGDACGFRTDGASLLTEAIKDLCNTLVRSSEQVGNDLLLLAASNRRMFVICPDCKRIFAVETFVPVAHCACGKAFGTTRARLKAA